VAHGGGESLAIPLPHPSGASSWIHERGHRALLDRALERLAEALVAAGVAEAGAAEAARRASAGRVA
jgi:hypothetical protein